MSLSPLKTLPRGRPSARVGTLKPRPERWRSLVRAVARHFDPPLMAIISLAAFLRFWELGRVGLRGDEAVYAGQAAVLAGAKEYGRFFILQSRGDSNFLLFQEVVSVVYRVTGVSDLSARAVAARSAS